MRRIGRVGVALCLLAVTVPPLLAHSSSGTTIYLPRVTQSVSMNALPTGYHTTDQIAAILTGLPAQAPAIASVQQIGVSWQGRPIWALRLCHTCTAGQPSIVYVGGQHAREIATPEILVQFAQNVVASWPADPTVGPLLDRVILYVIPVANPDGHVQVENGQLNWRKNTDSTSNLPSDAHYPPPGGDGVDLNRNFGFHWGQGGASATPYADTYQGPSAFSEPEDQALRNFLTALRPTILLDYHSPYATVLWPWGYQSLPTADAATFSAMGTQLAGGMGYASGQTNAQFGLTTGDTLDWAYGTLGTYALGVEIDGGFWPDWGTVATIYAKNRGPMLLAASWAPCPTTRTC